LREPLASRPAAAKLRGPPRPQVSTATPIQMSTSSSKLVIRIMRDDAHPSEDDVIIAERFGGNVHIQHKDGSHKNKKVVTRTVLTNTGLVGYVSALAAMIRDDTEPFYSIQFNFPGFPMVVYTPSRLHNPDVMRTIKNAARITSDYWFIHDPSYDADDSSDTSSTTSETSSSSSSSSSSDDATYVLHDYSYCCRNNA